MSDLSDILATRTIEWLERRPQLTLNSLSRITGVPHPTLTRVKNGEGTPSEKTIISLIPHLFSVEEQAGMYERIGVKPGPSSTRNVLIGEFEKPRIRDKTDFMIVCLLCKKSGVTAEEVEKHFGYGAKARLEYFHEQGLATKVGQSLFLNGEHIHFAERIDAFKQIGLALEMMETQDAENMVYNYTYGGLTTEGLLELYEETKVYNAKVDAIYRKHPGDLLSFSCGTSSRFILEGELI